MENKQTTQISMSLIGNAGEAKSQAFAALKQAKLKNFDEAKNLLVLANEAVKRAHKEQTQLLVNEARDQATEINVLLIHAQDHLMTTILAIELITEMVELYKEREEK